MKPKVKKPSAPQSKARVVRPSVTNPIELPEGMRERISQKAFELWRARGYREGYALQDWLDAEAAVMEEIHEARE
ncbi:MAG: DUF2934 domain-containing protein [Nitrospira sp.]|jgi:hypothetical protein|nr:DUF2934 domain-containing protein [Nitrospira sp.]